jgi:Fe-S cluster assembly protein SufD
MEAGAKLTLLEAHIALPGASPHGLANGLVDITVADGAALEHVACIMPGVGATHLSNVIARVGADASYRAFQLTCATGLARNGLHVTMDGTGSKLDISGAFLAKDREHIDTTLIVDHAKPGCESRELFKGVLDDRARGVFQGKIIVQPGADQTDGKQMAKALMLSEDAEFDSKPELEIFADDVACGHGATVAELDPALMFYCQSRGIEADVARALLIEAFIGEAIDKIADEPVRDALLAVSQVWLRQEAAKTAA